MQWRTQKISIGEEKFRHNRGMPPGANFVVTVRRYLHEVK